LSPTRQPTSDKRPRFGYLVNGPGVVSLVVATVLGLGLITSTDPNIARVVGFLLTGAAKKSWLGSAGIGVVVALVLAGALYALLTLFWRPRRQAA
jgi:hypothetical protein